VAQDASPLSPRRGARGAVASPIAGRDSRPEPPLPVEPPGCVVQPGDAYDRAKLLDLLMLVLFGAQERTEAEYRALLEAAGFDRIRVHPTDTPYSVVEPVRP
jgi:hypothetical protein